MDHFNPNIVELPSCPHRGSLSVDLQAYISYPSVSFVYALVGICSLVFALITAFKYNFVEVYNVKVRKPSISNAYWIVYYVALFLRTIVDSVKFALPRQISYDVDMALIISSLCMNAISIYGLTLALNHQRLYRSSFAPREQEKPRQTPIKTNATTPTEKAALVPRAEPTSSSFKDFFFSLESLFTLMLLIVMTSLFFLFAFSTQKFSEAEWVTYLVLYAVQRLPVAALMIVILLNKNEAEGPGPLSKFFLISACLCTLVNDLPLTLWSEVIGPSSCVIFVGSYVDLVHLSFCVGIVLFFVFLRREFKRNEEECRWRIVSERREYFDFRDF
eukprot:TRINITY_DN5484_c0_g1_i1.p1 TRINITY_DN5484_c0_g1~~TRINITY_DN5484_c0_g1_i1.p1  ORF type:complete len:331 (+),score=25.17 TRINITY_DN5484_c0_g1_i1:360-1352(+)